MPLKRNTTGGTKRKRSTTTTPVEVVFVVDDLQNNLPSNPKTF